MGGWPGKVGRWWLVTFVYFFVIVISHTAHNYIKDNKLLKIVMPET